MVNNYHSLDTIFHSLADPIRRDILQQVSEGELAVGELAVLYRVSFPAISKHLKVLESSDLIIKRKEGRNNYVSLNSSALQQVDSYLEHYRQMWGERFSKLDQLLQEDIANG